jgi:hypothetical protein
MKKSIIAFSAILLLNACQKEINSDMTLQNESPSKIQTQKEMVTRPISVNFTFNADITAPPVQCLPVDLGNLYVGGRLIISGTASHVGTIDPEYSWSNTQNCSFGPAPFQLTTPNVGQIAAANGDLMYFSAVVITNILDGSFTATVIITGGTGRFTDATGTIPIHGTIDFQTGSGSWTGEGTITY